MELYLVFVSSSVLFHFASLGCCSRHEEDPDSIMDTCVGLGLTLTLTLVNRNITSPCKIVCVGLASCAHALSLSLFFSNYVIHANQTLHQPILDSRCEELHDHHGCAISSSTLYSTI